VRRDTTCPDVVSGEMMIANTTPVEYASNEQNVKPRKKLTQKQLFIGGSHENSFSIGAFIRKQSHQDSKFHLGLNKNASQKGILTVA